MADGINPDILKAIKAEVRTEVATEIKTALQKHSDDQRPWLIGSYIGTYAFGFFSGWWFNKFYAPPRVE